MRKNARRIKHWRTSNCAMFCVRVYLNQSTALNVPSLLRAGGVLSLPEIIGSPSLFGIDMFMLYENIVHRNLCTKLQRIARIQTFPCTLYGLLSSAECEWATGDLFTSGNAVSVIKVIKTCGNKQSIDIIVDCSIALDLARASAVACG